jgi:DNA-binding winged helix-turn-helix (wHTH) protein/serine/threonine protein kinase/tetratricopeptide (TPR) repeat protein
MSPPGHIWRFAACEFDDSRLELRVASVAVDVEVKPLAVLHQLLLHPGEVVTKDELLESVWPGTTVVDGSLATAVSKLRKALGGEQRVIVTVPRIGYRLGVPVTREAMTTPAWPQLHLAAGHAVPGREQWSLVRRLELPPSSEVWLAEHAKTRERRVFKFASDKTDLRSLKREVTLARLLRDSLGDRPDFVRVLEWNFEHHPHFIESEFGGPNLVEWAEQQGGLAHVSLPRRIAMMSDIARAVAAAHGLDILHKDLKPANVLVSGSADVPQIKIGDFGTASLLESSRLRELGITNLGFTGTSDEAGAMSGTMMYMAPEVLAGQSPSTASDVFALGLLLYQFVVGDFRRPLTAGWEADVPDEVLREDIAAAANGDPSRRLRTAGELVDRLMSIDRRREVRAVHEAEVLRSRRWRPVVMAGLAAAAILIAVGFALRPTSAPASPVLPAVAVLPLQNLRPDPRTDYLRVAIADEVATLLSRTRGLAVRPYATTSLYSQPPLDLSKFGRDVGVDSVLTGHFQEVDGRLVVTLEAIEARTGRLVWRDSLDAPTSSMKGMQVQLALRIRGGLAPALGGSSEGVVAEPKNEEAYAAFLRSTALSTDPGPNRESIAMLQRAVSLDDSYAPAWYALSKRYYLEARYGSGDAGLLVNGLAAAERAAALDPDFVAAVAGLIIRRVERGDLAGAYQRAADVVRRRPDDAEAQFSMSYVLRYAGHLDEAAGYCERAFLLDPRNHLSGLRSCAVVFLLRGDYARTINYLHLDEGSEFERALTMHMLVAQGRNEEAVQLAASRPPAWGSYQLLLACAAKRPRTEIDAAAAAIRPSDDPETSYFAAAHLSYCGYNAAARDLLMTAIHGSYCSYPAMTVDPLMVNLRGTPEYGEVAAAGRSCREKFAAQAPGRLSPQAAAR